MDYARASSIIGRRGSIRVASLDIEVEVVSYKNTYGKDRWQIKPVAGSGLTWVEELYIKGRKIKR